MTTPEERAQHVRQMLANFLLEEMGPDEADERLLHAYIDGTATLDELLAHARAYAYDQWFQAEIQAAIDDPKPSIPHDKVMADIRALIEQKRQR